MHNHGRLVIQRKRLGRHGANLSQCPRRESNPLQAVLEAAAQPESFWGVR